MKFKWTNLIDISYVFFFSDSLSLPISFLRDHFDMNLMCFFLEGLIPDLFLWRNSLVQSIYLSHSNLCNLFLKVKLCVCSLCWCLEFLSHFVGHHLHTEISIHTEEELKWRYLWLKSLRWFSFCLIFVNLLYKAMNPTTSRPYFKHFCMSSLFSSFLLILSNVSRILTTQHAALVTEF